MKPEADLIIRNATLVTGARRLAADIEMAGGRFTAIEPAGAPARPGAMVLDAKGLVALPGLIDGHVHFREPGLEHEEDWQSGSRAAVMGGVTTVVDMPNTVPPTDTRGRAAEKLALAKAAAWCDFGIFGLVGSSAESVADLASSGLIVGLKAFMGPTTGDLPSPSDDDLQRSLEVALAAGLRVAVHAEDRAVVAAAESALRTAGRTDSIAHLESRPVEAEVAAIGRFGRLLAATGATGHVLHVSSADGLAAIARWRADGADLTCEVTPHHCLLDRDVYRRFGGVVKVNPPIRGEPHWSALLAALADGGVDCLASDHAPHAAHAKRRPSIWDVPAGFAGVETLLPLMLTQVARGALSLERLAHLTSEGPARAWGLWPGKGSVEVGADADLTLVDPARVGTIRAADLHGKNNATPFEGWPMRGAPVATIVRGRLVMRDGELLGEPGWGRAVGSAPRRGA